MAYTFCLRVITSLLVVLLALPQGHLAEPTPSNDTGSGYVWEPPPAKYHPTQPDLTEDFLHQRLQQEYGLKKLIHLLERFYFPPLPNGSRSVTACRMKGDAEDERPLCLSQEHLKLPDKWVTFEEFLRAPYVHPFPATVPMQHPAFPYMDGNGFKHLGDYEWETISYLRDPKVKDTFNTRAMKNRSLVFWSLGQYRRTAGGADLFKLRRALRTGKIRKHFFLVHHNEDNPEYPDWLLENPLVLKVFGIDIPESVTHPKLVPIPLGIRPHGKKIARFLELSRRNYSTTVNFTDALLFARGFSLGKQGMRAAHRLRLLRPLSKHFGFTVRQATSLSLKGPAYFKAMLEHRFVLSLRGTGRDAFRTWEAFYLGRPAVVGNILPPWVYSGLPAVVGDMFTLQPADLDRAWQALFSRRFNVARLWMPWWMTFILRECLAVP